MTDDLPEIRKGHPFVMYDMLKDITNGLNSTVKVSETLSIDLSNGPFYFTGNGTAYHAAIAGSQVPDNSDHSVVNVQAFELERFWKPRGTIVAFSHTGKTKSTIDAVLRHKKNNYTMGISHYQNAPLMNQTDRGILIGNGPDYSLCNTKAFFDNALFSLILSSRIRKSEFDPEILIRIMDALPQQIENRVKEIAGNLSDVRKIYVMGAGLDYVFARETAQKIREATHIFAEGTELEEFNHGCTAVMDSETLLIMADNDVVDDRVGDIVRGSRVIGTKTLVLNGNGDFTIDFPLDDDPRVNVFSNILAVYYFAYYMAVKRGINPDMLRFEDRTYREYDNIIFPPGTH